MFPIATCRQESAEGRCHSMTSTCSAYSSLYAVYQGYIDQGHPDHTHLEDVPRLTALAECVNEAERQSSLFNQQQELLIMMDGLAEVCNIAEL